MSGCCRAHYRNVTSRYVVRKYRIIDRCRDDYDDYNDYVLSIEYIFEKIDYNIVPASNQNLSLLDS